MKISLTFNDLLNLIKEDIPDQYSAFELTLASDPNLVKSLLRQTIPSPLQYAEALQKAIEQHKLPSSMKRLVNLYVNSASYFIPPSRKQQVTELKTKPPPPKSVSDLSTLSKTKTKKVRAALSTIAETHRYATCKQIDCTVCPSIFKKVAITKCTHPGQQHKEGYFPHLSRKLVTKIHSSKDYAILITIPGIQNPLSTTVVRDTDLDSTTIERMEVSNPARSFAKAPVPPDASSAPTNVGVKRNRDVEFSMLDEFALQAKGPYRNEILAAITKFRKETIATQSLPSDAKKQK